MRKINKGDEPQEWTEYKLTPNATYKRFNELADSLLGEQGYICAYCMRRIPVKDYNSTESTRIDHILSQTKHSGLQLDYKNMVMCCPGAINNDFHCDKLKGENDITIPLFEDHFITTISYETSDGKIKSSNQTWNNEINDILNLNNKLLKKNRLEVLSFVTQSLGKNVKWEKRDIEKIIKQWDEKDIDGKYNANGGIVIWYLKKSLSQHA